MLPQLMSCDPCCTYYMTHTDICLWLEFCCDCHMSSYCKLRAVWRPRPGPPAPPLLAVYGLASLCRRSTRLSKVCKVQLLFNGHRKLTGLPPTSSVSPAVDMISLRKECPFPSLKYHSHEDFGRCPGHTPHLRDLLWRPSSMTCISNLRTWRKRNCKALNPHRLVPQEDSETGSARSVRKTSVTNHHLQQGLLDLRANPTAGQTERVL